MDFDEVSKKPSDAVVVGQVLDDLSVEDLTKRLVLLKAEIDRVEVEIVNKKSTKSDAESVFSI